MSNAALKGGETSSVGGQNQPAVSPAVPPLPDLPAAAEWRDYRTLNRWVKNPRRNAKAVPRVAASIRRFGFIAPIVVWLAADRMVAGDTRVQAMAAIMDADPSFVAKGAPGPGLVRVVFHDFDSEHEADLYAIADNRLQELAEWDMGGVDEILARGDAEDRIVVGFDPPVTLTDDGDQRGAGLGKLVERFGVPPMSVLDARQGYWQDRKRSWIALGVTAEDGRENLGVTVNASEGKYDYMSGRGPASGGSIFDPVLCELAMRWFCPPGGHVLDPFGGECTKGVIAGVLGLGYTAVELRANQVAANQAAWERVKARIGPTDGAPGWICGDSEKLDTYLPQGVKYDFVWTSPPYYDLEIYSESDKDGSAFETYDRFMEWYETIFRQAVARLRPNRFLGVKIGEVRDKKSGVYRNFVGDNAAMFSRLGLAYYNEAILVTPLGSVPLRAAGAMQASRKLAKTHQNVLFFYKGDTRKVGDHFKDLVQAGDLPAADDGT